MPVRVVALIDANEADHELCRAALAQLAMPLITTWPAFTEAMYLRSRGGGAKGRDALWRLVLTGRLVLADLTRTDVERSAELMAVYGDVPMDLADATLVALAEERGERRVFSLDSDFQVYPLYGRKRFDVVPGQPRPLPRGWLSADGRAGRASRGSAPRG